MEPRRFMWGFAGFNLVNQTAFAWCDGWEGFAGNVLISHFLGSGTPAKFAKLSPAVL